MNKKRLTKKQKQAVFERARGCCEYCLTQARFNPDPLSIEHVIPRHEGGTTTLDNLALACQACNNHKYANTEAPDPLNGELAPLYHPRKQRWRDHFTWNYDFTLIIGLTPTGRATVEALKLNRNSLINLRQILHEKGEHPPNQPGKNGYHD